jgi:WD40 repeat protein
MYTNLPRGALSRAKNASGSTDHLSPAWLIWKFLNPKDDPLVHLRIEMPVILTFRSNDVNVDQLVYKAHRLRSVRTVRLIFWIVKIVVLPIAATTGALYGLLLYLLKNAELLEAQRNRTEANTTTRDEPSKLDSQISFTTLPRVFTTDVELIAASKDGKVVAAVGLQNEVTVWHTANDSHFCIDTTDILLRAASTSSAPSALTAVAVDANGKFCAVGTGAGMIAVWAISEDVVLPLPHLAPANSTSGVTELHFINKPSVVNNRRSVSGIASTAAAATSDFVGLLAIYENGVTAKWCVGAVDHVKYFTPSHPGTVIKSMALRVEADERLLVAHAMDDGTVELAEVGDTNPLLVPGFCVQAGSHSNLVSALHVCRAELGSKSRLLIGVTTDAGVVSMWDGLTGECITIFEEVFGGINGLRVSPIPCETCHYCGELPFESFSISISVGHVVLIYRAYITVQTRRCACTRSQPRQVPTRDIRGRRSRSSSMVSSVTPSPLNSRPKLPPLLDTSPFPVSGHGVHSRRASEKDSQRRASEVLSLPLSLEEYEPPQSPGGSDHSRPSLLTSRGSIWQNILVVRAADTTFEKGSWNTSHHKIVGVRRKVRRALRQSKDAAVFSQTQTPMRTQGLTAATLDRWELWTFDLLTSRLESSPLMCLVDKKGVDTVTSWTPSAKDRVPRLPFTHAFPFLVSGSNALVGFGNTVGVFRFSSP